MSPLTAISDDEMSDAGITSDVLPKKSRPSYKEPDVDEFDEDVQPDLGGSEDKDDEEKGDEEDGEDMDEDEYVVEKIFSHYIAEDVRCLEEPNH